jgi:hypothetical protein
MFNSGKLHVNETPPLPERMAWLESEGYMIIERVGQRLRRLSRYMPQEC